MSKSKKSTIEVPGTAITVLTAKSEDFISLTDMLKAKDGEFATMKSQADLLNVALFGQTAKQWRDANPAAGGIKSV